MVVIRIPAGICIAIVVFNMVHSRSADAAARRRDRATKLGFLRPTPDGRSFLSAASAVVRPAKIVIAAMERHAQLDTSSGAVTHSLRDAALVARPSLAPARFANDMELHRRAGRAKHNVSRWTDAWSDGDSADGGDPWQCGLDPWSSAPAGCTSSLPSGGAAGPASKPTETPSDRLVDDGPAPTGPPGELAASLALALPSGGEASPLNPDAEEYVPVPVAGTLPTLPGAPGFLEDLVRAQQDSIALLCAALSSPPLVAAPADAGGGDSQQHMAMLQEQLLVLDAQVRALGDRLCQLRDSLSRSVEACVAGVADRWMETLRSEVRAGLARANERSFSAFTEVTGLHMLALDERVRGLVASELNSRADDAMSTILSADLYDDAAASCSSATDKNFTAPASADALGRRP